MESIWVFYFLISLILQFWVKYVIPLIAIVLVLVFSIWSYRRFIRPRFQAQPEVNVSTREE
jgi:flagellar biogenesis protein FliO